MGAPNQFSAAASALGYLYQARLGLLWSLKRLRYDQDFVVSLETLDDVAFESNGQPKTLLQSKHHLNREADLSDASSDLWKSLRVWFEGAKNKTSSDQTQLFLITTAKVHPGSAASKLRENDRDVASASSTLEVIAKSSVNKAHASAYKAFLECDSVDRQTILERVVILDGTGTIEGLNKELNEVLHHTTDRKNQEAFLEYIEGWWIRRIIKQLSDPNAGDRISAAEIEAQMSALREQFKRDALPIADDLLNLDLDEAAISAHSESKFVAQMEIIKATKGRIVAAIQDYHCAFHQRSKWLRQDLLQVEELGTYEKRLTREWNLAFEAVKNELDADAPEAAKEKAAREVLKWAEGADIRVRPTVTESFVTRGSLHMLADDLKIGWHPEFNERLAHLLGKGKAEA